VSAPERDDVAAIGAWMSGEDARAEWAVGVLRADGPGSSMSLRCHFGTVEVHCVLPGGLGIPACWNLSHYSHPARQSSHNFIGSARIVGELASLLRQYGPIGGVA